MNHIISLTLLVLFYFWFSWLLDIGRKWQPGDMITILFMCPLSLIIPTFGYWGDMVSALPAGIDIVVVLSLLITGLYCLLYLTCMAFSFLSLLLKTKNHI